MGWPVDAGSVRESQKNGYNYDNVLKIETSSLTSSTQPATCAAITSKTVTKMTITIIVYCLCVNADLQLRLILCPL